VKHRHKHNKSNELKEELCEQDKQYKKTLHLRMKIKHRKKIEQEVKNNYGPPILEKMGKSYLEGNRQNNLTFHSILFRHL
jgi:hypothetical protein